MSAIGGIGGGSSAWQNVGNSTRGADRSQRMFAKVDSNGDGSVDSTELQGLLDKMAKKSGDTAASATDTLKTMDTDGNGTLSADELDAGMKSLMPAPTSTLDFAQQRGDDSVQGGDGPPPPPPPSDATDAMGSTSATSGSDSSDGLQSLLSSLFQAADADGNGNLDTSEIDTLKTNLDTAIQSLTGDAGSSVSSTSDSTSASSSDSTGSNASSNSSDASMSATLTALANLVLKEYAATAASSSATQTTAISLSA